MKRLYHMLTTNECTLYALNGEPRRIMLHELRTRHPACLLVIEHPDGFRVGVFTQPRRTGKRAQL